MMEGSASDNWTFEDLNAEILSGMMGNYTTVMDNNTTIEQTCRQLQEEFGQPLPIPMNVANVLRNVQAVYNVINLVPGIIFNLLVIVLILRFKKLQNITFILALQVCANDLINAAITFPTSATNAFTGRYIFTGLCSIFGFATFFLGLARTYLMFVLVLDRFCTVLMPFWYQRHRVKVVLPLSLGAWMLAFLVALVPVKGLLDCYSVRRSSWACFPSQGCIHQKECLTYNWTVLILSNMSSVVSLVMYLVLFCKARKLRNKVAIAPQPNVSVEEERAATAQKLKRERRANITFFLLYLSLIGVSLPPVIVLFIGRAIVSIGGRALPTAYSVVEILASSSFSLLIIVDPMVIMRNEDFRQAIKRLLNKIRIPMTLTEVISTSCHRVSV